MANFTVNIQAELAPQYTVTENKLYSEDDCAVLDGEQAIGLIKTTNTYDYYYLLTDYIDASSWKTAKITNVVYSNPTGFYLSDTLVKIPEAGAAIYDFDITGQAVDIAIPNLTVTYNTLTLTQHETIEFDLAIENLLSAVGDYVSVKITLKHRVCPPDDPFDETTVVVVTDTSCKEERQITVHVPPEGSRYVEITHEDGHSGASGIATPTTITSDETWNIFIDRDTGGIVGTVSVVCLRVYLDSSKTTSVASNCITRNHNTNIC